MRPTKDKRLEEIAIDYVNELIYRNLIIVDEWCWNGRAKICKIHDLLRDLCLSEAQKQGFVCVMKHQQDIPQCMNMERRICIHDNTKEKYFPALESATRTRSLIATIGFPELVQSSLLRVYSGDYNHCVLDSLEAIFQKVNLRYLTVALRLPKISRFPSSWFLFWNLQTLKVDIPYSWGFIIAPCEIWEMPLLRHVMIKSIELPDPLCGENHIILEDLQTLSLVGNLKLNGAVIKRIPNIKTLKLLYHISGVEAESHSFGFNYIGHLTKLQSLNLYFTRTSVLDGENLIENLCFPHSLKKLTLVRTKLNWEDCTTMIGSLPLLQFFKLGEGACFGPEWETVEGQFCSLKFLHLECYELRCWITEDTHFPLLEHLVLRYLRVLEEIPPSIGDISTLKSIRVHDCSTSAEDSAKRIEEEQLDLGNTELQFHITASGAQNPTSSSINEVMAMFVKEKFDRFTDVLNDFGADRIGFAGLIREIEVLAKEDPNVIHAFKILFPDLYEIAYTDKEVAP